MNRGTAKPTTPTRVRSEHRIEVTNVEIPEALLGASFRVEREGHLVELALPGAGDIGTPTENPRLTLTSSHADGDPAKNGYSVSRVLVRVPSQEPLNLPQDAPSEDPIAFKAMYAVVEKNAPVAELLLSEWMRIIRWKSLNAWVGRPADKSTGWRGSLYEGDSSRRLVGTGSHTIKARWTLVTEVAWRAAAQAMDGREPSPLWFDLALDGEWHGDCGDLRRCVIDTAVACEVYLKSKVLDSLPLGRPGLKAHLTRTPVSTFRDRLFPDLVPFSQHAAWQNIKGTIAELFTARNDLMHDGHRVLVAHECRRYRDAARTLLTMI